MDRKEPIEYRGERAKFTSRMDLSGGVEVRVLPGTATNQLLKDTAKFTAWWKRNFFEELNGFQGMDTVEFSVTERAFLDEPERSQS